MKKIDIILKGRKFAEKLFGTKKKGIRLALETAENNLEQQKNKAMDDYETSLLKLADDNVDYKMIINQMIDYYQKIINAENTIELINKIKSDLETEIEDGNDTAN